MQRPVLLYNYSCSSPPLFLSDLPLSKVQLTTYPSLSPPNLMKFILLTFVCLIKTNTSLLFCLLLLLLLLLLLFVFQSKSYIFLGPLQSTRLFSESLETPFLLPLPLLFLFLLLPVLVFLQLKLLFTIFHPVNEIRNSI